MQGAAGVAAALIVLFALDFAFYPWGAPMPNAGGVSGNRGENGLWLRYTWYFGQHSDAEIAHLGQELTDRQVQSAFFDVRYIGHSGNLRYRYPEAARRLNAALHRATPGVRSIAPFADCTTTEGDWWEYRRDWLGR